MKPLRADRAQDAFCDEFLAGHSDYLDGLMPPLQAARMSAHAEACASCGRYDRIVRRSLVLARELPDPAVTAAFELRLEQRLRALPVGDAAPRPLTGVVATLGVAAALAMLAWSPLLLDSSDDIAGAAQPGVEMAGEPAYAAPLLIESAWYPVATPDVPTSEAATLLATLPGPYSPLIVTPPAHRTVRTVSSEQGTID